MKKLFTFLCFMVFALAAFAQGNITGKLIDAETDEPLIGASVLIEGTSNGTVSDFDGNFTLNNLAAGSYTLIVSYIGYDDVKMDATVTSGDLNVGSIACGSDAIGLSEVKVVASYAENRKTPVAVSNISSEEIELKVGNQEFVEVLKSTPSVYATKSGGGFGDSRITIRGFDQTNVAVMINGIPVNDMENGRVFWSNWAGLADVTKMTQIQRGLGASKLAINSVGGTINIITKTTDQKQGGSVFSSVGNNGYLKYGATVSTGRTEKGWAFTFSGSRTTGDGYVDATWINAWSYFGSIAKEINDKHQLVFTAIGAPQRHGQRSFREGLRQYVGNEDLDNQYSAIRGIRGDLEDAEDAGDSDLVAQLSSQLSTAEQALDDDYVSLVKDGKAGDWDNQYTSRSIRYNSDWGYKDGEIFNNRENFYHKPQIALNHYWDINPSMFLATSAYYSTGRGGGTGDLGRIGGRGPWGWRDSETDLMRYDDIVSWNRGNAVDGMPDPNEATSYGFLANGGNGIIRRASMNEHNWIGVLSTLNYDLSDNLKLLAGVDVRQYRGLHYRRVIDLLGNDGWVQTSNSNNERNPDFIESVGGVITLEDSGNFTIGNDNNKIAYDNDGIVGWQGGFAQLEYSADKLTVFGAGSLSNTSYTREDRFNYAPGSENEVSETFNFIGYNAKAGANVNITDNFNLFVNAGYYSKAPTFDGIFRRFNNVDVNPDPQNEKIIAGEAGVGYGNKFANVNVNYYYTSWQDRTLILNLQDNNGDFFAANLAGVDALHTGIEIEASVYPTKGLTLRAMASIGDWQWKNDVVADISDDNQNVISTVEVYQDGLKVGDAAQTTLYGSIAYDFRFGLGFDFEVFAYDNLYADFDPTTRNDANATTEEKQPLKLPAYQLANAGLTYKFKFYDNDARFRVNVNNVFDELYIAETRDQGTIYESGGFFGFGRTWNVGLKVNF